MARHPTGAGGRGREGPSLTSGGREQEPLFEHLRASADRLGARWGCSVEGGGDRMRARPSGLPSGHVMWSGAGSQVVAAFQRWLSTGLPGAE